MTQLAHLDGIEAARQLAALSPETQSAFDESMALGWSAVEQPSQVFRAIGATLARKRAPVSDANKKKLFAFAEELLKQGSGKVMDAVATCMLEAIWTASRESGFDFSLVDPYLGPEARRYLTAWDDFARTQTKGLTRE